MLYKYSTQVTFNITFSLPNLSHLPLPHLSLTWQFHDLHPLLGLVLPHKTKPVLLQLWNYFRIDLQRETQEYLQIAAITAMHPSGKCTDVHMPDEACDRQNTAKPLYKGHLEIRTPLL